MDYFVSFNGHLVEKTRPDGWPRTVKDQFTFRCNETDELVDFLNQKAKGYQSTGGMTVAFEKEVLAELLEEDEKKTDRTFANGFFVPMHMIAYINYTIRQLAAPVPTGDVKVILQ